MRLNTYMAAVKERWMSSSAALSNASSPEQLVRRAKLTTPLPTATFASTNHNSANTQFLPAITSFTPPEQSDWSFQFKMAPRRGAEPAPEEPEQELVRLTFNEPLSWRAGKPIVTGELLKRLDTLSNELQEMDQEEIDKDSFTKVAKELAGQQLLGHKDKGVRAFTACCLVDVLKLCAPDAPFTPTQLKVLRTFY